MFLDSIDAFVTHSHAFVDIPSSGLSNPLLGLYTMGGIEMSWRQFCKALRRKYTGGSEDDSVPSEFERSDFLVP